MKSLVSGVLTAVMLAASGAQAQETTPPPKPALDTVEVVGHREKLSKEVQTFVGKLTQLDGNLVSSWETPICPKVVAEDPDHAEYIRQRLLEVAAEVPFSADADEKCSANLFVVVTSASAEFVAEWKKRDPGMFIWRPRRGVSRSPETLPVRTWHNVAIEPAGGILIGGAGEAPKLKTTGGSTRIVSPVSENLQSVLVLVDTNRTAGVTLRQLADYIAMVSFSKVDLDVDFGRSNSILRLFADDGIVRPDSLTTWDLAFLRGLYRQSFEAVQQRQAITNRMVRDLVENVAQTAQP